MVTEPAQEPFGPISLEARALGCVRGGRCVFEGLGFSVAAGGALILRGPNGSGKSTLLRALAGLLQPSAGEIRLSGTAIGADPEGYRALIHYAGHAPAIKPALSVVENLAFWARLYGAADDPASLNAALDRLGLTRLRDMPARYLSDGQRRRTALARLVAVRLPIWLLDEPATGLDTRSLEALEALLDEHISAGGVLIAAVHGKLSVKGAATLMLPNGGLEAAA